MIVICEGCQKYFQVEGEGTPSEAAELRCEHCRRGLSVASANPEFSGPVPAGAIPDAEPEHRAVSLSESFDRAVEEDRADTRAAESNSQGVASRAAEAEAASFEVPAEDDFDPVLVKPKSLVSSRPVPKIQVRRTPGTDETVFVRRLLDSARRVQPPPPMGPLASFVGWTLTLALCVLGLLQGIRGSLAG